jgi:proline utilization trans-activator
MVHESLFGLTPPPGRLLFEGQAYEIDWQGASTANTGVRDTSVVLPTSDFALFLINTVKFRCGQLFHLFNEESFMQSFSKFHSSEHPKEPVGTLWYVHYLLILALGKALVVVFTKGTKPAGSELFVEAMRILPDVGLTAGEPVQSMEILCCAALYLQCLDKRKAAYNQVNPYDLNVYRQKHADIVPRSEEHYAQPSWKAVSVNGMIQTMRHSADFCFSLWTVHTNMSNRNLADPMRERCREIWWTIYILDSHMSALMGVPQSLSEHDVTAQLPEFAAHTSKSLALGIHVKLARATSSILQSALFAFLGIDRLNTFTDTSP